MRRIGKKIRLIEIDLADVAYPKLRSAKEGLKKGQQKLTEFLRGHVNHRLHFLVKSPCEFQIL